MKILVAIDTSAFAATILDAICTRKWPNDCEFYVMTVAESSTGWFSASGYANREAQTAIRQRLSLYVQDQAMMLKKRLAKHLIFSEVLEGSPSEQIVDAARRLSVDLIILGQQGTAQAGGFSLGGIAEAVVQKAPCSVEVVKPKVVIKQSDKPLAQQTA